MRDGQFAAAVLEWYDRNARTLPWRIGPGGTGAGIRPDPYGVWLSEVMLQQTTVPAVAPYFEHFTKRWPTVAELAEAPEAEVMSAWAGLGYYARARNLIRCARVVAGELSGEFPSEERDLVRLPGIGPYTAAAIAAIAFGKPATVVDGNIERVMARLFAVDRPIRDSKRELRGFAAGLTPAHRPGDYAQALMDIGATICTPRAPRCRVCPVRRLCKARKAGAADRIPAPPPRTAKPVRRGDVFVGRRTDGAWLLERRPGHGLLGGMLGWPGTGWDGRSGAMAIPPLPGPWRPVDGEVRHTFTHFHLRLRPFAAELSDAAAPRGLRFVPAAEFSSSDLPTVMRKAFDMAWSHLGRP